MFGLSRAEKVKRDHRIEDIIKSYGITLKQNGKSLTGLCPFHNDSKTPSLSITPEKGLWHCFGCNVGGSVIDWVAKIEKISDIEAIEKLAGSNGNGYKPSIKIEPPKEKVVSINPLQILNEVVKIYHNTFKQNQIAQEYIRSRGITDAELYNHFQIGYSDGGSLLKVLPESGEIIDTLKEIGILNDSGNESFYKCLTFPIKDDNGVIVGLYGRSIEGKRHVYLKGPHKGVWNIEAATADNTIILTEAIIDAMSAIQLGIRNIIPLYGANGLTEDHIDLFKAHKTKEIIFCLDNDETGQKATEKYSQTFISQNYKVSSIKLPEGIKDINEFLTTGGTKEQLEKLISGRISKEAVQTGEAVQAVQTAGMINSSEDTADFMYADLLYKTKGLTMKGFDSIRLVITVDDGIKGRYTDRIDLYTAKSRRMFANAAANKLNKQSAKIEDDLLNIVSEIERLQAEEMQKTKDGEKKIYQMTDAERQKAITLLKDPNLLDRIVSDLDTCGYVGEPIAKKLVYLSAVSRKTKTPLSIIIRSASSAGKSELMNKVSELMPPEEIESFSRVTPMALYYMPKDHLMNKLLIIDERAGSEEADYSIRTLQSRDKLTLALPVKDPSSGKTQTKTIEMLGPCVIWSSSTESHINPENVNRCFEIYLDESINQTKAIIDYQKKVRTLTGWKNQIQKEQVIRQHRNAQRLLKQLKVIIPYTELIEFPLTWLRVRRDHERFLSLIEMVAFLHQAQREQKQNTEGILYIEATIEDYEKAYSLARTILVHSLQDLSKPATDLYKQLIKYISVKTKEAGLQKKEEYKFTRRQIRERLGWEDHNLIRALNELVNMEYVVRISGHQGKIVHYTLSDAEPGLFTLNGLTTPDELRNLLKSASEIKHFDKSAETLPQGFLKVN